MRIIVCNSIPKKPSWVSKIIKWWEKVEYSHTLVIIENTVYEAGKHGFLPYPISKWEQDNNILMQCNCVAKFNLSATEQFEILDAAIEMVGTRYGFTTLLGCAFNDMFGLKWFADGRKSMICSESIYYLFKKWLPEINEPADFVSPKDIERLFGLI